MTEQFTPKPQFGTWTLTAPDGRTWTGESPLRACSAEQRERIPAEVALQRIYAACDEPTGLDWKDMYFKCRREKDSAVAAWERGDKFPGYAYPVAAPKESVGWNCFLRLRGEEWGDKPCCTVYEHEDVFEDWVWYCQNDPEHFEMFIAGGPGDRSAMQASPEAA